MTHAPPPLGPSSTRKRLATLIAVVGMVIVGGQMARVWPRNVDVAYEPDAEVRRIDVDIVQDGEAVASVRFERAANETGAFFHGIRLQPGEYRAHITVYEPDGRGIEHSRLLIVPADGVTRFDLRE